MRERIGKIATEAAAAVGYRSAGTVEGLQEGEDYFFLEMNTRVQVEHCVTEMATGIDIVREQVLIAAGEQLSVAQEDVELRGHAIECRINAEAAHKGFAPAPGRIEHVRGARGPGRAGRLRRSRRVGGDAALRPDDRQADRLGHDRERATARMLRALDEYEIGGLTTLIPFHRAILATEQWRRAETCRDLVGDKEWLKSLRPSEPSAAAPEARRRTAEPLQVRDYKVEVDGRLHERQGDRRRAGARPPARRRAAAPAAPRARARARGGGGAGERSSPRSRARCSRSR